MGAAKVSLEPAVGRAAATRLAELCDRAEVLRVDGAEHGPGVHGVAGPSSPGTVYRRARALSAARGPRL
ncbi:hypothetical protein NLM24_09455 [Nocardia zapadnayensis]|uniref:hypothetical protein n=1 Tax=Nocardia rhamnosiphila TaxID=426716 RepID=UPI002245E3DF|nr:hypothetical protein [Nocardia zapadnayensis]MCX0270924.1 hypothetical protein [Nocardia zapadnayensis]